MKLLITVAILTIVVILSALFEMTFRQAFESKDAALIASLVSSILIGVAGGKIIFYVWMEMSKRGY